MSAVMNDIFQAASTGDLDIPVTPREAPRAAVDKMSLGTIDRLGALQPLTDDEMAANGTPVMPTVNLLMTEHERKALESNRQAWDTAKMALVEAESALARAERTARNVDGIRMRLGELSARAYTSGEAVDKAILAQAKDELDEATSAAAAVPVLAANVKEASAAVGLAAGRLKGNARTIVRNCQLRQAAEYERLAVEMVRVVGHMMALAELAPQGDQTGHNLFVSTLALPSPVEDLRRLHKASENLNWRDYMLHPAHSHLNGMRSAAAGWFSAQLAAATGLRPDQVL